MPTIAVRYLARPALDLRDAFLDAQRDYTRGDGAPDADGLTLEDLTQGTLASYIDGMAGGLYPRPGVRTGTPGTELWWCGPTDEGVREVLGRVSLRHHMVPALRKRGGQLWWSLRPSRRGQGLGTELFTAALGHLAGHGLSTATLVIPEANTPARKIIEAAGGVLDHIDDNRYRWYHIATT
ncbi:hypothetical protein GCM10010411_74490 [Actinomadura fulvescens]|uniref:N-acetyltransferase domain-containing protein n=1 Tax=Actinomadura fulvescens TaxID=46160 RepID=A0ABN3QI27_9ACTN